MLKRAPLVINAYIHNLVSVHFFPFLVRNTIFKGIKRTIS